MSEIEKFVLGYLQEVGGLVEPPAYGIYEALLPERVAARWRVPAYLQLAFGDTEREATVLGYNHPLVEQMVQEASDQAASSLLYINNLRLDKTGVDDLAVKSWVVLNARTQPQHRSALARVRSTYVRFNFKAALLSDEKQERLVSLLMDAQTGSRVPDSSLIELRASAVSPDAALSSLPDAPLRWQPKNGPPLKNPLDDATLSALLNRAETAVLQEMQADLELLKTRVARFRQLDEARLTDYYDTLEKDLQSRLRMASPERQPGLQDKLAAVLAERRHKLADLAERYQVHINLTLLNVLVIQQPKLIQGMQIANRSAQTNVYAVWDPLLNQLEPLYCQVCGQAGERLYLCQNGHLAHEGCLAPACIDCKRVFCGDCAQEVGVCDVCHAPLCRHSQVTCRECGRHTCQAHLGQCHAADGQPLAVAAPAAPPVAAPLAKVETPASPAPAPSRQSRSKTPPPKPKPQLTAKAPPVTKDVPKVVRMEVILHFDAVAAYLLGKRDREFATRVWRLSPEEGGILRNCRCEKGDSCRADRTVLRPWDAQVIEKQIYGELLAFANEYGFPVKKIRYNRSSPSGGDVQPAYKFELTGLWKNETALNKARKRFEDLP